MTKATQTAQATWLMILSLLSQVAVWVAFTSQYVDSRQMDSACRSNVPDGAVFVGETTPVVEDVTFLPIGRACTYEAVNGGTIAVQTGQLVTGRSACRHGRLPHRRHRRVDTLEPPHPDAASAAGRRVVVPRPGLGCDRASSRNALTVGASRMGHPSTSIPQIHFAAERRRVWPDQHPAPAVNAQAVRLDQEVAGYV